MNIIEINDNIFNHNHKYYAHCISSDYALGAGIAVEFEKRFDLKRRLNRVGNHSYPDCILVDNVFNLVTKCNYWNKPTYDTLKVSLIKLYDFVIWMSIKDLAIPRIGCGIDKLSWYKVKSIIEDVFINDDITITVYYI